MRPEIPVLMFHSVRPERDPAWPMPFRATTHPLRVFEAMLAYVSRKSLYTATLQEVYDHKRGARRLPRESVCLTFDDGYLDNWVFLFPLLKKYAIKATVFMSGEFIDRSRLLRPTLEDCWAGRVPLSELPRRGFLNPPELRAMEHSGLVRVESHAMTHTYYAISERIIDFCYPNDPYFWMSWNRAPEEKPNYMATLGDEDRSHLWGAPVYEHAPAIVAHRHEEDGTLTEELKRFVHTHGGKAFFLNDRWRERLECVCRETRVRLRTSYTRETPGERAQRLAYEINTPRQLLGEMLGREIHFLAWPHGAYDDEAVRLAHEAGYGATTAKGSPNGFNVPEPHKIARTSVPALTGYPWLNRALFAYKVGRHHGRQIPVLVHALQSRLGLGRALSHE